MKKQLLAAFLFVVASAACGGPNDETTGQIDTADQLAAQTYSVQVNGQGEEFHISTTSYFPSQLSVTAGSTIEFESLFTGDPHTVTFGTLVDEGLKRSNSDSESPLLAKLPHLLPNGPGAANPMAAHPCVLASGDPPTDEPCPKVDDLPEFDGTQTVYSSGFMGDGDGDRFKLRLADDIKPGTYSFFCLLHRQQMTGAVKVVDAAEADSPAEVKASGRARLDALVSVLKPVAEGVAKGENSLVSATPGQVAAGGARIEDSNARVNEFGPRAITVARGSSVTWVMWGPHTISFNPPSDLGASPLVRDPDGTVRANESAFAPHGGPGQGPLSSGPPPRSSSSVAKIVDGGTYDGTGFRSSGLFVSFPPVLEGYKLTFTKAGTFPYRCLIHTDMAGTVTVT